MVALRPEQVVVRVMVPVHRQMLVQWMVALRPGQVVVGAVVLCQLRVQLYPPKRRRPVEEL